MFKYTTYIENLIISKISVFFCFKFEILRKVLKIKKIIIVVYLKQSISTKFLSINIDKYISCVYKVLWYISNISLSKIQGYIKGNNTKQIINYKVFYTFFSFKCDSKKEWKHKNFKMQIKNSSDVTKQTVVWNGINRKLYKVNETLDRPHKLSLKNMQRK